MKTCELDVIVVAMLLDLLEDQEAVHLNPTIRQYLIDILTHSIEAAK